MQKNNNQLNSSQLDKSGRNGFTILELVTVIGVIAMLLGLLLPAVNAARETARQVQCKNNLYQIGIALHNYHDIYSKLPSGWRTDSSDETAFGWAASILPYLGNSPLSTKIDFSCPVNSVENQLARLSVLGIFRCPSDIGGSMFDLFEELHGHELGGTESNVVLARLPSSNYVGVFGTTDPDNTLGLNGEGAFVKNRWSKLASFRRGLSNTTIVGERSARKLPSTWFGILMEGEDAEGRVVGNAWLGPNRSDADECEFDSRHPGIVNFLWGDGHVKSVSESIDMNIYRNSSVLN